MNEPLPGLSTKVLIWARTTAGLSVNDVATALEKEPEIIESWENGDIAPTYSQLEKLAYELYKRPLAAFFLPLPPEEVPLSKEFRTLPRSELATLEPDTRKALREIQARQANLHELTDGINPSDRPIFRALTFTDSVEVEVLARQVREFLGISLNDQIGWSGVDEGFERWRTAFERAGVFVFKRSFEQREISGFCILDDEFPVICVNNSTPRSRQIFTLFHELCHVLFHTSGICKIDDSFINNLRGRSRRIESLCNRFAGVFLVPEEDLQQQVAGRSVSDAVISDLASRYKTSRSVVLRRFYELGKVSKDFFQEKEAQYIAEYMRYRSASSGGNYYPTHLSYLGRSYVTLVLKTSRQKKLTKPQIADYLGVRARNIEKLEQAAISFPGRA
jgi:Zn-dependent peptidase ImmA (M78 family)